jgi:hypothetical protein
VAVPLLLERAYLLLAVAQRDQKVHTCGVTSVSQVDPILQSSSVRHPVVQ